ncbi:MAG: prepilin-type N-terminal cleavage/methylation domain-containing protein [Elusimicrobia bacterium]|nr:prepilin-type N-terminal cleavage/methylation domain-containing protein [Elusimicrobiota bacterium]
MAKLWDRDAKGYTLTELMLVVAILGVLAMIGPRIYIGVTRFFRLTQARVEIQREARGALDLINRNLRQARASMVVIDQISGQPPYSRIEFTQAGGKTMKFYQQEKSLYLVDVGTRALTENLRYIAFTYPRTDDDQIVSVSVTLEKETYEGGAKALQLSVEKVRIMND